MTDFSAADEYLLNDYGVYTIPTLFQTGPSAAARSFGESCPEEGASDSRYCQQPHTPHGDVLDLRDDDVAAAVEGYLTAVGEHYAASGLRHFGVINEPARFHHYDLGVGYSYDWEPARYVELLEQTATTLKTIDLDFTVVMGGMVYYDLQKTDGRQELWEDYFDKVLRLGGGEFIDVVNFHYYGHWAGLDGIIATEHVLVTAALPDIDGEVVSWRQRTDEPIALGLVPFYIEPVDVEKQDTERLDELAWIDWR
jgi:hypothetical protein